VATTAAAPTVLVLNDSPGILNLFHEMLSDAGYRVSIGQKLFETVDELVAEAPDLLILDFLWSGDGRGWDFVQQIRADSRTTDLPIILCITSGPVVERRRDQFAVMRIQAVLKPFDVDDLLAAVAAQLARTARDG
jgi:DNA-binding response OmpR family regulator